MSDAKGVLETQLTRLDVDYIERWAPELGVLDAWRRVRAEAK